jgi:hypothetical protein
MTELLSNPNITSNSGWSANGASFISNNGFTGFVFGRNGSSAGGQSVQQTFSQEEGTTNNLSFVVGSNGNLQEFSQYQYTMEVLASNGTVLASTTGSIQTGNISTSSPRNNPKTEQFQFTSQNDTEGPYTLRFRVNSSAGEQGSHDLWLLNVSANGTVADGAIPCFLRGTIVQLPNSSGLVENLKAADLVHTLGNDYQPIRWIGSRKLDAIDLAANPKLRPIRIRAGALGDNIPDQDLTVSPQHRMLIRSVIAKRMFDTDEILVPAVKLLALDGVERVEEATEVEYFHILFDKHEVIFANGAPSESLYTGKQAMKSLSPQAREEITTLFPEICNDGYQADPARLIVQNNAQVKKLLERHQENQKALVSCRHGPDSLPLSERPVGLKSLGR